MYRLRNLFFSYLIVDRLFCHAFLPVLVLCKKQTEPGGPYNDTIPLLPVKPEEDDMSIFLEDMEHGKEEDCV
jgi:hypothetical protein